MASLSDAEVHEIAKAHDDAERSRVQIAAATQSKPDMDLEDAYRIQSAWVLEKVRKGAVITGRKVGLTSRAMQEAMKINEPDFGTLLDHMEIADRSTTEAAQFTDPRLEVELAFILKSNLSGPKLTISDVMAATDYVAPALELIAARTHRVDPITGYIRTVVDTISDNAANAGYVISDTPIPLGADLPRVGSIFSRNGTVEETGLAAGVMGHPAHGLCWLAKRFAPHGIELEAGQVYLAGSFTRPVIVRPGDEFKADFGDYGSIEIGFS